MPKTRAMRRRKPAGVPGLGLCSSCAQQSGCTYFHAETPAALECDEYEPAVMSDLRRARLGEPLTHNDGAIERSAGLCSSCTARPTCTFPLPEGGVWHCQEYR